MADLSIGVIGTGGMGTRHAMNLHRHIVGARVAGVYDLDDVRAAKVAAECGGARVFSDPLQLIEDQAIEAVLITSPDHTHAEFALACVQQGKPVLSEKPLATRSENALKVVEAEMALGRRLVALGFMRRFDSPHVAVHRAVKSGELGRALLFKGSSREQVIDPNTPVETILTNSVIHDLDSTRWMMEQEVREVFVRGLRTRPNFSADTFDLLLISMSLTNDALALVEASLSVEYGYDIAAQIICERGVAESLSPDAALIRRNQQNTVAIPVDWLERFQTAYVSEVQHWVNALHQHGRFTGATAWDGYISLLIAEACVQSLRSGQPTPVPQPAKPALYAGVS